MGRDGDISAPRGAMSGVRGGGEVLSEQELAGCITSKPKMA